MIKTLLTFLLLLQFGFARDYAITGNWYASTRSLNNGTETIEKEYLNFYPNSTFELVLLVSVKKGEAFVKDLRIEVSGSWEAQYDVLVYVIKKVEVPVAKEVYLIDQRSLENLAATFKYKYENDKIHISKIKYLDRSTLTTINERGREDTYSR